MFRHPLLRSAIVAQAPPSRRRAAHRALAEAYAGDAEERAWHRAAAATEADSEVATLLEKVGGEARARNAHGSAARAYQRAAELEPLESRRARLLLAAGQDAWQAGQAGAALPLLDGALAAAPRDDPLLRSEIQHLRGHVLIRSGQPAAGGALLTDEARRVVESDHTAAAFMLCEAVEAAVYTGNHDAQLDATARLARIELTDGGLVEFFANFCLAAAQLILGRHTRARAFFHEARPSSAATRRYAMIRARWRGRSVSTRGRTTTRLPAAARTEQSSRTGKSDLGELGYCLHALAGFDFWMGRWDTAEAGASEAARLTLETDQVSDALYALSCLAYVAAGRGRADDCRRAAQQASEIATRLGGSHELAGGPLGLLLLGCSDPQAAIEALAPVVRLDVSQGQHCPAMQVYDLIEAHTRAGNREAAQAGLAAVERRAFRPWERAGALRCRGLLTTEPESYDVFAAAADAFDALGMQFERARTQLCHGERLRRAGQRTEARTQLRRALEAFDALGAAPWSKHARDELRASGATLRRPADSREQLTPRAPDRPPGRRRQPRPPGRSRPFPQPKNNRSTPHARLSQTRPPFPRRLIHHYATQTTPGHGASTEVDPTNAQ